LVALVGSAPMAVSDPAIGPIATMIAVRPDAPGRWAAGAHAKVEVNEYGVRITYPDGHRSDFGWEILRSSCVCPDCLDRVMTEKAP